MIAIDAAGVGAFFCAIGDVSVRAALDTVEGVREIKGNTDVRQKVSHVNWAHPGDFARFQMLSASVLPNVNQKRYRCQF